MLKSPQMPGRETASTAVLTVDLAAIAENYASLRALAGGAECAAVVKADAYGTGAKQVAPCLHKHGCQTFFVATPMEGMELRKLLPDVKIYILDGLLPGGAASYHEYNLSPVLGSLEMLAEWSAFCVQRECRSGAALHIDTGMNRLGIGPDQLSQLLASPHLESLQPDLVMSHLACADEPEHPRNQQQLDRFRDIVSKLPPAKLSLANSAGIFLGSPWHYDVVRPGIALYGGCPTNASANPMAPTVFLTTRIAQIRTVEKGDSIGYGAAFRVERKTRLATLPVGYADGYPRALGSSNEQSGANVCIGDHLAPLLGRVSMDLITVDITDVPLEVAFVGASVELIGAHILADELARVAQTISYEILTSLGSRYERHYKGLK